MLHTRELSLALSNHAAPSGWRQDWVLPGTLSVRQQPHALSPKGSAWYSAPRVSESEHCVGEGSCWWPVPPAGEADGVRGD